MAQPYVGEIRMFAGNFAPVGWLFCDGQIVPIAEYETLFNLIGTTYGGDGENTFRLPDLQGRLPIHQGTGPILGENGGVEEVTLTVQQIPSHPHPLLASTGPATSSTPIGNLTAESASLSIYIEDAPSASLNAAAVAPVGGSQPHTNFQPYLCINYIISMFGLFPSPT